jgi:hypothetical protein
VNGTDTATPAQNAVPVIEPVSISTSGCCIPCESTVVPEVKVAILVSPILHETVPPATEDEPPEVEIALGVSVCAHSMLEFMMHNNKQKIFFPIFLLICF